MIRTGVIAAAGRGTRLLPFSAFVPKEMLPLGSIPVIQYVVEELFEAGIERLIIITDPSKVALINFFDVDLHKKFLSSIKDPELAKRQAELIAHFEKSEIIIDFQAGHYGNATPLIVASKYLNNEPFFYTWADDFIKSKPSRFAQLAEAYDTHKTSVLSGVKARSDNDYSLYAYIESENLDNDHYKLHRIHEKPGKQQTPSDMGVLSGHLFSADILEYIDPIYKKHDPTQGEFLFNTIIHEMIDAGHTVIVKEIQDSDYIDTGNVESYQSNFKKFMTNKKED